MTKLPRPEYLDQYLEQHGGLCPYCGRTDGLAYDEPIPQRLGFSVRISSHCTCCDSHWDSICELSWMEDKNGDRDG